MNLKIAFFTPINPLKSGVSDFCEELLMVLKDYVQIDLFIDEYTPSNKEIRDNFRIRSIKEFNHQEVRDEYDEVIYQVGNNEKCHEAIYQMALKYPGIIELHDISLHHMLAAMTIAKGKYDQYREVMTYCHGQGAVEVIDEFLGEKILPPWENQSLTFMVNKKIIDSAKAVIVHSDYAKQIIKGIRPDIPIATIYLHSDEILKDHNKQKEQARQELQIKEDELIFATFGFITRPKRILETLQVLKQLKEKGYTFKFYIVGQVDKELNISQVIKEYDLETEVIVTGFVDLDYMKQLMKAADICFCLRYPTQGESSAIVHRLLGMGKVIVVTDVGTFSEYPDDVVIKINQAQEEEQLMQKCMYLIENRNIFEQYQSNAVAFASEYCNIQENARKYRDFIDGYRSYSEVDIEEIVADVFYRMGIVDEEILERILG